MVASESESISLPDGRTLAFATYGDPDGTPLLFHHGTPGSSHLGALLSEPALARGVRVIAPSRPGYGRSDPDPDGTFETWADDCRALADTLGLESFAVAGFSGGGPHALAVAARHADRVSAVGVVGAPVPAHDGGPFGSLVRFPHLLGIAFRFGAAVARLRGDRFVVDQLTDRSVDDETARVVGRDFRVGLSAGPSGAVRESRTLAAHWSPSLPDGGVTVWHGVDDQNAPIGPVRTAYEGRSAVTLREVDDDHLGTLCSVRDDVVGLAD
ncbi:alpha/beta hydrolase [Natrinema saccharevitans]|uniref:Alpha/beta hydrolase n=1 Tax=Natrinema saccharevitans TaxID=301967 RepID=A0A1S8B080_9EURY|nr:alpha/beta hydrolase [Natrinema saccharevitans]OLZ42211.1 alpha/beta hydrolase [Natrinema saccharevitans]